MFASTGPFGNSRVDAEPDVVILVHGMLSGTRSMRAIAASLSKSSYRVINWGYPTLTQSLQIHGQNLGCLISEVVQDQRVRRLHFAGHSMGCIILRIALQCIQLPEGSRFVMLAPPNSGSRLTRLPLGVIGSWFPQLGELSESADSLVNRLAEPEGVDVGVLAAKRDLVVDVKSTYLESQQDHLVIPTTHQRLPVMPEAVEQVRYFLQHGSFDRRSAQVNRAAA